MINRKVSSDYDKFISKVEKIFSVTPADVKKIIDNFHQEMRRGLAGRGCSLKMIPSFVDRPAGSEAGRCLALDLGGTNSRVLAARLDGKGNARVFAVSKFVVSAALMRGAGEALFDFIAGCVREFLAKNRISLRKKYQLAFTFSFPVEQTGLAAGKLIIWTKGFSASGVEGKDVVRLLDDALWRSGLKNIEVVALANDTVGTLVTKSYSDRSCDMGVILGTGTNACYVEKVSNILKMKSRGNRRSMIINMEWGNFSKLRRCHVDRELDRASGNPGRQYLEKMVSGMYLGEITRRVVFHMISKGVFLGEGFERAYSEEYSFRTEDMSLVAAGGMPQRDLSADERKALKKICDIVSLRSARIAGGAIAAVLLWMDKELRKRHTVAIDGSLFEKYPGFEKNIKNVFRELFGRRSKKIKLEMAKDGSGAGAAVIAAWAQINHISTRRLHA